MARQAKAEFTAEDTEGYPRCFRAAAQSIVISSLPTGRHVEPGMPCSHRNGPIASSPPAAEFGEDFSLPLEMTGAPTGSAPARVRHALRPPFPLCGRGRPTRRRRACPPVGGRAGEGPISGYPAFQLPLCDLCALCGELRTFVRRPNACHFDPANRRGRNPSRPAAQTALQRRDVPFPSRHPLCSQCPLW